MAADRDLRVLVVDDSAYNRRVLAEIIEQTPGLVLVGKAHDGEEALQMALTEKPDVITLDLEMPRMDGFTFLRLLMVKRPTPVIVISCHTEQDKVFRALELGALDFVAKPTHLISPQLKEIKDEVVKKLRLAKTSRLSTIPPAAYADDDRQPDLVAGLEPASADRNGPVLPPAPSPAKPLAHKAVLVAASTGGPPTITRILADLSARIPVGIAIVQHMPLKFTVAFAQRLDSICRIQVKEAALAEPLLQGTAYIAPGKSCLEIRPGEKGFTIHASAPLGNERYVPSADRLFRSAASAMGPNALAIVLTGMGDDGARGVRAIAASGGCVVAEDESTAVIQGMPRAAVLSGCVHQIAPLDKIAQIIRDFAQS